MPRVRPTRSRKISEAMLAPRRRTESSGRLVRKYGRLERMSPVASRLAAGGEGVDAGARGALGVATGRLILRRRPGPPSIRYLRTRWKALKLGFALPRTV